MKRCKELRALSSEHHSALVLAKRARKAAGGEAASTVWPGLQEKFASELEPHFKFEEEFLLPALGRAGEGDAVMRTLNEHQDMRKCIAGAPGPEALARFADLLEGHVRFEERELFEIAQQRLSQTELREIEAAARKLARSGGKDYT